MSDLARSFDDVATAYDFGRPRYDELSIDAIAAAAGGGPRLLDVGAGTGRLSGPLLEKGFDVVAVEPLDGMRAILAGHIGADRALAGRAEDLPLPDASVDGAVSSDAWHWFDGARAADELARVVRPGGGVVVCTTYPRWYGSDDAPDWWLISWWSTRRCPRAIIRHSCPAGDDPTSSRVTRPSRRWSRARSPSCTTPTARGSSRTGHRCRSSRRCPRVSAPSLLGQLDGMLARRGVEEVDIPYRAALWITRRRPG